MVLKGKVPVSTDVLKITLPKPTEADLPSGLHLMVLEDHRLPQVSFQIFIPGAGGYHDPPGQSGLASFTAALMREGTSTRSSSQISEQLEVMAASLTVTAGISGLESTISGSCLTDQLDRLLELTADVLLHPSFAREEVERFTDRTSAQLVQQRANPSFLASELLSQILYGTHPASRVSPSVAALNATTPDTLLQFHRTRYVPDHAAIAISGDISMADASCRPGWLDAQREPGTLMTSRPLTQASKIHFIARPNSVQTNLVVAPRARRTDPDYDILRVMNTVIGGGPTASLLLREGKVPRRIQHARCADSRGDWSASTTVRTGWRSAPRDLLAEITNPRAGPEQSWRTPSAPWWPPSRCRSNRQPFRRHPVALQALAAKGSFR